MGRSPEKHNQARASHPSFCPAGRGWVHHSDCCGRTPTVRGFPKAKSSLVRGEWSWRTRGPGQDGTSLPRSLGRGCRDPSTTAHSALCLLPAPSPTSLPLSLSDTWSSPSLSRSSPSQTVPASGPPAPPGQVPIPPPQPHPCCLQHPVSVSGALSPRPIP